MKNKFIKGLFVLTTVLLASCSDELNNQKDSLDTDQELILKIKELSDNHIKKSNGASFKKDTDWARVAAADTHAASGAYLDGEKDITIIVMEGAIASKKEYNSQHDQSLSHVTTGEPNVDDIGINVTNPYDNYGYWHYKSIENARKVPSSYLTDGKYDNEKFYKTTKEFLINNKFSPESFNNYPIELANERLKYNKSVFDEFGLVGGLKYQTEKGKMNEVVYEVLYSYFNVVENVANVEKFVSYSLQTEKMVVNSNIKERDKGHILSVMATARYGLQYWNELINK